MTRSRGLLAAAAIAAALSLPALPAGTAAAGPTFGSHVVACAHNMGFSGTHNPGMHQGAHGWDGMTCSTGR